MELRNIGSEVMPPFPVIWASTWNFFITCLNALQGTEMPGVRYVLPDFCEIYIISNVFDTYEKSPDEIILTKYNPWKYNL